ncbi:hypothetical protein [Kineobactrum salinum]|nr:hypothetical protein [Kineobactrum salinum]
MRRYFQTVVLMLGVLCASAQAGISAAEKRMLEFIDATNPGP